VCFEFFELWLKTTYTVPVMSQYWSRDWSKGPILATGPNNLPSARLQAVYLIAVAIDVVRAKALVPPNSLENP